MLQHYQSEELQQSAEELLVSQLLLCRFTSAAPRLTQTDLTEPQETHFWVQGCSTLDIKTLFIVIEINNPQRFIWFIVGF